MRALEIIDIILWNDHVPDEQRAAVEQAIIDLDVKAFGNGRQRFSEAQASGKLNQYVRGFPSASLAARALGVSRTWLHDVQCGRRPMTPAILEKIGLERAPKGPAVYFEI